jgi:hypothetical protein
VSFAVASLGLAAAFLAASWSPAAAQQERTPAPKGAAVYFQTPVDGQRVTSPVRVRLGLREAGVAPAGVRYEGSGHHHVLVDTDLPPLDQPIPADFNHVHLGGGQTEVLLQLPKGRHVLQLLFADHAHIPHNPPVVSRKITIFVQ